MSEDKKHADFQSQYKKSSNFDTKIKDINLKVDGKGNLVKDKDTNILSDSEREKIADSMDKMHRKIEMIPGGQSDEEE